MVDHYLQKHVISVLVKCESARYGELKPTHIEGNVFSYHLQNLIKQKMIVKNDDGSYRLTNDGRLYGINNSLKKRELLLQAHAIVLVSVRDHDRWLLRKRLVQPMFGKIGFMHGEPRAGETIERAGQRILRYRTGLDGMMTLKGAGFICLEQADELVAYSNFTLLEATDLSGNLVSQDAHGENAWHDSPDFSAADMIPSMPDLVAGITEPNLFFLDKTYQL